MSSILVIEDNLEVRENICELLELSGYTTYEAEHGKIGVQLALEHQPDLILCDVMMPVLDGHGTLKVLRSNSKTATIPFVFLTAKAEKGDFRTGMNLGADDYITKPFTDLELLNAVELRLSSQRRQGLASASNAAAFFNPKGHFEEALATLLAAHPAREYRAYERFYVEGEQPKAIYYLREGRANSYATNDFGKELSLSLYRSGDLMGLHALLGDYAYRSSAWAMTDCTVISIPKTAWEAWLSDDPSLSLYLLRLLSRRALKKNMRLLELAYSSTRKRVAEGLLCLYHCFGEEAATFTIPIKREELAHLVGTTKETVTRTLSEFKEDKLLTVKGSILTLIDIEGLEQVPD